VYYATEGGWRLGASIKSPRWFESFHFQSTDELGRPRTFTFNADLPMVISLGTAYAGFDRWLLGADAHYIDFRDARGLGESGFTPDGAARGVGQRSIWAFAAGAQYRVTDALWLRLGYSFSQNPIDTLSVSANVASPTIIQHTLSVGASYQVSDSLSLHVAYGHGFQNSATGPLVTPLGVVPGTAITSVVSADTFVAGATLRFGAPRE
jgi:long-chain fatty acid transport protein